MHYLSPQRVSRLPRLGDRIEVQRYAVATLIFGAACELEDSYEFFNKSFSDSDCPPNVNGHFRVLWFFVLMTDMYKKSSAGGDGSCDLVMEPLQANGCAGMVGVRLWILFFKDIDENMLTKLIEKVLTKMPSMPDGDASKYIKESFFRLFRKGKKRKVGNGSGRAAKQRRRQAEDEDEEDEDETIEDGAGLTDKNGELTTMDGQSLFYSFMNYIGNPYTDNHYAYKILNAGQPTRCHMLMDVFGYEWAFREKFKKDVCAEQMNEMNYFSANDGHKLMSDSRLFTEFSENFSIPTTALVITNFSPLSPTHWKLWNIMKYVLPERRIEMNDGLYKISYRQSFLPTREETDSRSHPPAVNRLGAVFFRDADDQERVTEQMIKKNEKVKILAAELASRLGVTPEKMTDEEWVQNNNDILKLREQIQQYTRRMEESGVAKEEYQKYIKKFCMRHFLDMIRDSKNIPPPLAEQVKWFHRTYPTVESLNKVIKKRRVRVGNINLSYFDEFIISVTDVIWHKFGNIFKNIKEGWMLWLASFNSTIWLGPYSNNNFDEGIRGYLAFVGPNQTGKTHIQKYIKSICPPHAVMFESYNSRLANSTVSDAPGAKDQSCVLKIFDEGKRIIDSCQNDSTVEDLFKSIATGSFVSITTVYVSKGGERLQYVTRMRAAYVLAMNMNMLSTQFVTNPAISSRVWTVQMPRRKGDDELYDSTVPVKKGMIDFLQILSYLTNISLHMMNAGVFKDMDVSMFHRTVEFFNSKNKTKVIEERRIEMLQASAISMTVLYSVWITATSGGDITSLEDAFVAVGELGYIPREITLFLLSLYSSELYFLAAPESFRRIFTWPPPMPNMRCMYRDTRDGTNLEPGSEKLNSKAVNKLCILFSNEKEMYQALAEAVNTHEKASGQYNPEMIKSFVQMQSNTMVSETGFIMFNRANNVTFITVFIAEATSVMYIDPADYEVMRSKQPPDNIFYFQLSLLVTVKEKYERYKKMRLWVPNTERVTVKSPERDEKLIGFQFSAKAHELRITEEDETELDGYKPYCEVFKRPSVAGVKCCPYKPDKTDLLPTSEPIPMETKAGQVTMSYIFNMSTPNILSLMTIPGELSEQPGYGYSSATSMFAARSSRGNGHELIISLSWMKENHTEGSFEDLLKKTFSTNTTQSGTTLLSGKYVPDSSNIFDTIVLDNDPENKETKKEKILYDAATEEYNLKCKAKSTTYTEDPTKHVLRRTFSEKAHELLNSTKKRQLAKEYNQIKEKMATCTRSSEIKKCEDALKMKLEEIRAEEEKYGIIQSSTPVEEKYPDVLKN